MSYQKKLSSFFCGISLCVIFLFVSGDGIKCQPSGCNLLNDCDANAKCTSDGSTFICQCNAGFIGNGQICRPQQQSEITFPRCTVCNVSKVQFFFFNIFKFLIVYFWSNLCPMYNNWSNCTTWTYIGIGQTIFFSLP